MSELSDYKRLVVEPDERAMRAKLAGLRGRVEAAEFSLALLLAARAEGPAPVSAPLDREGVEGRMTVREAALFDAAWAMCCAIRGGGVLPLKTPTQAADESAPILRASLDARNAALSQQDQVGLTTPAVLGEPSADEEFLEFKEALSDLRSLRHEHDCLNGGGPGWSARNAAAWAKADELFANEDEAAYDRQQEDRE